MTGSAVTRVKKRSTDKDHWFEMSYPFCPIPTDPAEHVMPALPLADKAVYYATQVRGTKQVADEFCFLVFLSKFFLSKVAEI
jgi:hypothetical protein